jgi:hypothetical protein
MYIYWALDMGTDVLNETRVVKSMSNCYLS